jgi:hypothetical protein
MSEAYLVQLLLPRKTGKGEPVTQQWFDNFLKELTASSGGATSFLRAPGQGLWRDGARHHAIVEVMTEELAQDYWRKLRERLESVLSQEEL